MKIAEMKKILVLGICVVAVLAIGTLAYIQVKLSRSNAQLQEQMQSLKDNQPASLDSQAKCATQSQIALNNFETEMVTNGYKDYSEQNYYNQKMGKCFVLIDYTPITTTYISDTNYVFGYEDMLDAYENSDLASCISYSQTIPSFDSCLIGNNGATPQQYRDFVNEKMGMALGQ